MFLTARIVALGLATLAAQSAWSQEVSRLEVRKALGDDEPRTSIDIYVPMDVANLDFENPMDPERSALTVARDDTGADLLAAHEAAQAEWVAQGYSTEPALSFGGVADYAGNKDVTIAVQLRGAPASGARTLSLEGTVVLNFIDASGAATASLEGLPLDMGWDSPGVDTAIGKVKIESSMSMTMGEDEYQAYTVSSADAPIVAVTVAGGDATAEVREMGMAIGANQFVIKGEAPATVNLEVEYASTTAREVPFALEFGIGL